MKLTKNQRRTRIKNRIRKIISGTESQPRLSVFRSNKEIYAQLIDDIVVVLLSHLHQLKKKFQKQKEIKPKQHHWLEKNWLKKLYQRVLNKFLLTVQDIYITEE